MLSELFFVVKTFLITAAVVLLMQLDVGGQSLETRGYQFFTQSGVSTTLNSIAQGAIKVSKETWEWVTKKYHQEMNGRPNGG